jgi:hypothetical protein
MELRKNIVSGPTGIAATGITFACSRKSRKAGGIRGVGMAATLLGAWLLGGGPSACSSVPVKMQCSEIQARIDYGNLSGDQLRFAKDELDDCRGRQHEAEQRDSGLVDSTEKRFTPEPQ